jgi:uncharacterized OB-fold protein
MSREELLRDPYVAAFPELLQFWEAAARGVLLLPRCTRCGEVHWHPRPQCPFCRCETLQWAAASGRGTLHTFTVIQRGAALPDVLAYVALEEGVLVLTNIVDADPELLRIGMPVRVAFRATPEGRMAPVFMVAAAL